MRIALLLVLVAFPLLELVILIRTGQAIGLWPTVAIVLGTAFLGATVLRWQGFQVLNKLSADLEAGRPPIEPIADGAMLLVAGALLISPGLLTDVAGLLLLIPPVRTLIRHFVGQRILNSPDVFTEVVTRRGTKTRERDAVRRPRSHSRAEQGPIIEGDYERVDETGRDPDR
jgi:UPF0716 protein FxsA